MEPADTTDTITWKSSNTAVATVDTAGKVTAVATGTAIITATAGSKSATCNVTVEAAPCTHTNKTDVPEKNSSCKEKGWDAYSKCDDCGQLFNKDGDEISTIPYRLLASHEPLRTADVKYLKSAATCTSAAVYYEHCSVCDEKLGTTFNDGSPPPHKESGWKFDKDDHWKECEDCSTITFEKEGHTPDRSAATEDDPIKCTVCDYIIASALGHTHSLTKVDAEDPTCTAPGNKEYYICSGCKKWYEDGTGVVEITDHSSVEISKLGHKLAAATCTAPKTCQRDGCDYTEGIALGHNYAKEWSSNAKKHWHECTRCQDKKDEEDHTPDREAADCTTPVKCTICKTIITPAKGHNLSKIDAVDATCTTGGTKAYYECSRCSKWFETSAGTAEITDPDSIKIAALGHDYADEWSSNASKHWHECTRCGDKTELEAHDFGTDNVCDTCGYKKSSSGSRDTSAGRWK